MNNLNNIIPCSYSFTIKSPHNIEKYHCTKCNYSFKSKEKLLLHQELYHNKSPCFIFRFSCN